jgi:hypothetical protein
MLKFVNTKPGTRVYHTSRSIDEFLDHTADESDSGYHSPLGSRRSLSFDDLHKLVAKDEQEQETDREETGSESQGYEEGSDILEDIDLEPYLLPSDQSSLSSSLNSSLTSLHSISSTYNTNLPGNYNTVHAGSMNIQQINTLKHMVKMFKPRTDNSNAPTDEYRVSKMQFHRWG